jgi:hypothetical protein
MNILRRQLLQPLTRPLTTYAKQSQLFLHPSDNGFRVSFSKDPTASPTIGKLTGGVNDSITPSNFTPNKDFVPLLQRVIVRNISDDFTYMMESKEYSGNYMPIYDLRSPPRYETTPEVEDIFGFIWCDDTGKVKDGSYEQNDQYQLVSQSGGVIKLSDYLLEQMRHEVEEKN